MNTILRKQFLAHVGQTSPEPMMIEVARAEGVFFYTPEGKRYYDLVAGVSVSNVGHANPRVVEAVQRQAADYMHIMVYGEMIERPQVRYAARIAELLPGELSSVYFVNSGAEAIEGALKLAKRYTHRTELVSMRRAYHGSTQGAMSLMGEPEGEEWKGAFRTRCKPPLPWGTSPPSADIRSAAQRDWRPSNICWKPARWNTSKAEASSTNRCWRIIRRSWKSGAAACCWPSNWARRPRCSV